jgi:hypothetical protein
LIVIMSYETVFLALLHDSLFPRCYMRARLSRSIAADGSDG